MSPTKPDNAAIHPVGGAVVTPHINRHRRLFPAQLLALLGAAGFMPQLLAKASPEVMLAQSAPPGLDPKGYLVSEKLDGVRALWDGQVLRFRSGRAVAAPAWFLAKLPATALDGELWLARGSFDLLSGIVRKTQPVDAEWQKVTYVVFESPDLAGPFSQRADQLQKLVKTVGWPQLQAVAQATVDNAAALRARLKAVTDAGGEGLMLHLASAEVTGGRTSVLLKLKNVQDGEGVVTGHVAGKGKYQGMLGALEIKTASGTQFKLGSGFSDAQRRNPPPIGATITYTYRDVTATGKPRFASFLRLFDDS